MCESAPSYLNDLMRGWGGALLPQIIIPPTHPHFPPKKVSDDEWIERNISVCEGEKEEEKRRNDLMENKLVA